MLEVRNAKDRGVAEHGWLSSRHTFSFASYYDPQQMGFSDLLVINDDRVQPGRGFGNHPHRDVEIFSYVLEGSLEHKDSMGTGSIIRPDDVQLMSAGTGVVHSEFNPSSTERVHFLQIWVATAKNGTTPRYQQRNFAPSDKRGKLRLIMAQQGTDDALEIRQDVRVYAGLFDGSEHGSLTLAADRFAYVHVARGQVTVNGTPLGEGDGVRVRNERELTFADGKDAEVLVFDLRNIEVSEFWS